MPGYTNIHGVDVIDELINMVEGATLSQKGTEGRYKATGVVYEDGGVKRYQEIYGKQFVGKAGGEHAPVFTGQNCPPGKVLYTNDEGRWCLKPCKEGHERNPDTHRCFKPKAVRRRRMKCREGYGRNPETGRCKKKDDIAVRRAFKRGDVRLEYGECPENKYRSHTTKRCRKVPPGGIPQAGAHREYGKRQRGGGIAESDTVDDVDYGGYTRTEFNDAIVEFLMDAIQESGLQDDDALVQDLVAEAAEAAEAAEEFEEFEEVVWDTLHLYGL